MAVSPNGGFSPSPYAAPAAAPAAPAVDPMAQFAQPVAAPAPGPMPMFGQIQDSVHFGNDGDAAPADSAPDAPADEAKSEKGPLGRLVQGFKDHFAGVAENKLTAPFKLVIKLLTLVFALPGILFRTVKPKKAEGGGDAGGEAEAAE